MATAGSTAVRNFRAGGLDCLGRCDGSRPDRLVCMAVQQRFSHCFRAVGAVRAGRCLGIVSLWLAVQWVQCVPTFSDFLLIS